MFLKVLSVILGYLGLFPFVIGITPFIFDYPYHNIWDEDFSGISGPANLWELYLMISYDIQYWALCISLFFFLLSFVFYRKSKSKQVDK